MTTKEPSIPLRNPKKRVLSSFMAEQLLYDYASKTLDEKREKAVSESLQASPSLTKSLDDIIYGMTYCHHLQKTSVTQEFLNKFKSSESKKEKLKKFLNPRQWANKSLWPFEAFVFSVTTIFVIYATPWSRLIKFYVDKTNIKQNVFISEMPKDASFAESKERSIASAKATDFQYQAKAELHTVNVEYTVNKLASSLPKIGASIEHHSNEKNPKGELAPYFKMSIPKNQTEALIASLKKQGQLTWIASPSENDDGGKIFGMELWILRQVPPKAKPPAKELNEE